MPARAAAMGLNFAWILAFNLAFNLALSLAAALAPPPRH